MQIGTEISRAFVEIERRKSSDSLEELCEAQCYYERALNNGASRNARECCFPSTRDVSKNYEVRLRPVHT